MINYKDSKFSLFDSNHNVTLLSFLRTIFFFYFYKIICIVIIGILYVYIRIEMNKKKLVKRYLAVGQIVALQPSSGKNYNFLLLKLHFLTNGQQSYTKPSQIIHVIPMKES